MNNLGINLADYANGPIENGAVFGNSTTTPS